MKSKSLSAVNLTRIIYLIFSVLAGVAISVSSKGSENAIPVWLGIVVGLIIAVFFIILANTAKKFSLRGLTSASIGLLVGVFSAWALNKIPFGAILSTVFGSTNAALYELAVTLFLYISLGFLGVFLALRAGADEFAVLIPYVRFRQQDSNTRPVLLDDSAVVDGRLTPLLESGFLDRNIILPRYILDEIQVLANSPSSGKRESGERAMNALEQLKHHKDIKLTVYDKDEMTENETVNIRLIQTAKNTNAKLVTTNEAISQSARLHDLDVLNLDDLANALRPPIVVGEKIKLNLTRGGKEDHQGVGYLSDGSMIVVNQAAQYIGTIKTVVVVSKLQTSSGLMVFADLDQ